MHALIRQLRTAGEQTAVLARFRFHECGMVMAFRRDVVGPLWIAKRVESEPGRLRLRNERNALEWLAPWQQTLRVPRMLAWSEDESDACLILSGVTGHSRFPSLRSGGFLDVRFQTAQDWLRQFHRLVPSPEPVDLLTLHRRWSQELGDLPRRERRSYGLWAKFEQTVAPSRPSVPVHNDFWWGNLLFDGGRIGVVDWDGLRAGTPLDDLLTLLLKSPVMRNWTRLRDSEAFRVRFFAPSPARRLLLKWARECELSAEDAEFCFYSFLIRRMHWELGMSLQPRAEKDRQTALWEWSAISGWLAEQQYPNPFAEL